ncbi:MAG TPA: hypothetical protein VJ772_03850 [Nitrososphaeraceae archaeon]|nr:hypothetical protein [Nitrososphaeraceae archaeon]
MVKNKKRIKIIHEPTVNYTFWNTGSKNIREENAETVNKTLSSTEKEIPRGRSIGNKKIRQKNRIGAERI